MEKTKTMVDCFICKSDSLSLYMLQCKLTDLRHSIWGRVHELSEVHHAFPLVLRDVDGLDRGETWICISEVLQL